MCAKENGSLELAAIRKALKFRHSCPLGERFSGHNMELHIQLSIWNEDAAVTAHRRRMCVAMEDKVCM